MSNEVFNKIHDELSKDQIKLILKAITCVGLSSIIFKNINNIIHTLGGF